MIASLRRVISAIRLAAGDFVRRLRRPTVVYYPRFQSAADLANHYHRARWYLPYRRGACEHVVLYAPKEFDDHIPGPPPYMGVHGDVEPHVCVHAGGAGLVFDLLTARAVLLWKPRPSRLLMLALRLTGARVARVATDDPASREFGVYPALLWRSLCPTRAREQILSENRDRFVALAQRLRGRGWRRACVFGTGPSLERAADFDFSETLCVVCNSIVQNDALLDRLRPAFICAGDSISHFGVSAYAHRFRLDLVRQLENRDIYLVTTADFGHLFLAHFPALTEKVFLIGQDSTDPVYDLAEHYGLPRLDSTLNIHMLPLAATFAREIQLLGCDGKSARRDNEDFWAHAAGAQYRGAVESGHQCHPTFDAHRQRSTYDRYIRSIERTIAGGERRGYTYVCLSESAIPVLNARMKR